MAHLHAQGVDWHDDVASERRAAAVLRAAHELGLHFEFAARVDPRQTDRVRGGAEQREFAALPQKVAVTTVARRLSGGAALQVIDRRLAASAGRQSR